MAGLYQVYKNGQTQYQIGDNTNLFDWTYVGNVARAHLLAADKLTTPPPSLPITDPSLDHPPELTETEKELTMWPLPSIDLTTGNHRIPHSEARPLGPCVTPPPNAAELTAAFTEKTPPVSTRPVGRTRFDALSEHGLSRQKLANPNVSPLQVAGQVFFITNGEPCYFWDFPRLVWHHLDGIFPDKRSNKNRRVVMPKPIGMAAAAGAEWWGWLVGKEPTFTRYKVAFSCAKRWHNIEKARRVLEYEPEVGIEEGVRRMVDVRSSACSPNGSKLTQSLQWWKAEYETGKLQASG